MNLVHNLGLDLRTYSIDDPIAWTRQEIVDAAASDADTFVRRTVLRYYGPGNLKTALNIADIALRQAGEEIGAIPVKYSWGFYPELTPYPKDLITDSSYPELLPKRYSLVAEVENVKPAEKLTDVRRTQLGKRIEAYHRVPDRYSIGDLSPGQCVEQLLSEKFDLRVLRIVDIEPRVADKR